MSTYLLSTEIYTEMKIQDRTIYVFAPCDNDRNTLFINSYPVMAGSYCHCYLVPVFHFLEASRIFAISYCGQTNSTSSWSILSIVHS